MFYYRFRSSAGYCGTEQEFCLSFEEPLTKEEQDDFCEEYSQEAFESFSYLATGWNEDFESEEEEESFREQCECDCIEITQKEYEEWEQ